MLVHGMTLVSFRLFRKNLGNLGEFFGQMAGFTALPVKKLPVRLCVCEYVELYSREDSLSSVKVLPRGVFSLFTPLKLRSAAHFDTGYVSNEG